MGTCVGAKQYFAVFYKRNFWYLNKQLELALILFNVVLSNFYFESTNIKKKLSGSRGMVEILQKKYLISSNNILSIQKTALLNLIRSC